MVPCPLSRARESHCQDLGEPVLSGTGDQGGDSAIAKQGARARGAAPCAGPAETTASTCAARRRWAAAPAPRTRVRCTPRLQRLPRRRPPAASRFMFLALLGLGLGQVVCSVALFLYFRAQVSGCLPPPGSLPGETESGPRAGLLGSCLFWKGKRPSKEGNLGSSSQVHPRLLPAVRCAEVELLWFW